MNALKPIIRLKNISFSYPGEPRILNELNLDFFSRDRIGLIAPNGSGKTTLFHLIMGLLKPTAGEIEIFGKPMVEEKDFLDIRPKIGLLFQDADDQLFSPTVLEDVAFGPLNQGKSKKEALEISMEMLKFLGLDGFEDRITFKLSGGEKRLVSLATILAMDPEVLLLDEPLNGLDARTKEKISNVLSDINLSIILISHELEFLNATTSQIFTMENGKILSGEEVEIHQHVHAHPHGTREHKH